MSFLVGRDKGANFDLPGTHSGSGSMPCADQEAGQKAGKIGDLIEPKFSTSGFWILRKLRMKNALERLLVFVACTRFEKPEQFRCFLTKKCSKSRQKAALFATGQVPVRQRIRHEAALNLRPNAANESHCAGQ